MNVSERRFSEPSVGVDDGRVLFGLQHCATLLAREAAKKLKQNPAAARLARKDLTRINQAQEQAQKSFLTFDCHCRP